MADNAQRFNELLKNIVQKEFGAGVAELKEDFRQEDRPGKYAPLPEAYHDPRIIKAIEALGISPEKIYTSQAEALDWFSVGISPFLTTETASGKSFVFQVAALKKMLEEPDSRILVLYPTRALNSDQLISWRKMMEAADLPANKVGLLDGGVRFDERLQIVNDARILIATPDIIHTWMLADPQIKDQAVQDFIKNIRLRVIDETHMNDGVFGTKFSYLMRRLTVLQRILNPGVNSKDYWEGFGQVIAASATISDAAGFLHQLTGLPTGNQIYVIEPAQDGSPRKARNISRVAVSGKRVNDVLKSYLEGVAAIDPMAKSILFVDSRKSAEMISRRLNRALGEGTAASYKSGYRSEVRNEIEDDFRNPVSPLKILVATSAAEVGINMLPVKNVINVGIPEDASSLLQRAGRIRQGGQVIVIERAGTDLDVAPHHVRRAFLKAPRRPILYRKNEGIQAQMLACALDEIRNLTGREPTVRDLKLMTWPDKFMELAKDVLDEKRHVEDILHRKIPSNAKVQRYFSLRDADGGRARVVLFVPDLKKTVTLEEISHLQALSEAYPGGSMLHRGSYYRIKGWNSDNRGEYVIHASHDDSDRITRSFVRSALSTNLYFQPHHTAVQTPKMRTGLNRGDFVANVGFIVRTSVEGFTEFEDYISDTTRLRSVFYSNTYKLDDSDPCKNLKAPEGYKAWHKGVLVRIQENWFHKNSRKILGSAIIDAYTAKRQLSKHDFVLHVDDIEARYSSHYGYNKAQGYMMAICESSTSDFGLAGDLANDLSGILIELAETHESEEVRELALVMYQWHLTLHETNTLTQDQAAGIHLQQKSADEEICFMPNSVVAKETSPDKTEMVRIKDVQVVAGSVLYQYEPFSTDGKADIKAHASKAFLHSLPSRHFAAAAGYWYSYGTVNPKTGLMTTEANENFDKLGIFDIPRGKKEMPPTLRLFG